jgi:hypothetical protein
MAEEYVLVKKTTYDRMKQSERVETHDRGVNTEDSSEETPPQTETRQNPPVPQHPSDQSGSGLTYAGKKRESASPPGMRTQKRRRQTWLKF